jgi:hypothetical protein
LKTPKILLLIALAAVLVGACIPQSAFPTTATAPAASSAGAQPAQATALAPSAPATCSAVSILPTPGPTEISLFPPPTASDWKLGPDTAQVTFMEYSDFQ